MYSRGPFLGRVGMLPDALGLRLEGRFVQFPCHFQRTGLAVAGNLACHHFPLSHLFGSKHCATGFATEARWNLPVLLTTAEHSIGFGFAVRWKLQSSGLKFNWKQEKPTNPNAKHIKDCKSRST